MRCRCCRPARGLIKSPTSCYPLRREARWTTVFVRVSPIRCREAYGPCIFAAGRRGKICWTITVCASSRRGRVRSFRAQTTWILKPARLSRPIYYIDNPARMAAMARQQAALERTAALPYVTRNHTFSGVPAEGTAVQAEIKGDNDEPLRPQQSSSGHGRHGQGTSCRRRIHGHHQKAVCRDQGQ